MNPQGFGHGGGQGLAAQIFADDFSFPVQQVGRRDLLDAILYRQFVPPAQPVEILRPGQVHGFGESGEFRRVLIQADADDLKSLVMIFFVRGHDMGQFGAG